MYIKYINGPYIITFGKKNLIMSILYVVHFTIDGVYNIT